MAYDVLINGATYHDVPGVKLPLADGSGYAEFGIGGGATSVDVLYDEVHDWDTSTSNQTLISFSADTTPYDAVFAMTSPADTLEFIAGNVACVEQGYVKSSIAKQYATSYVTKTAWFANTSGGAYETTSASKNGYGIHLLMDATSVKLTTSFSSSTSGGNPHAIKGKFHVSIIGIKSAG